LFNRRGLPADRKHAVLLQYGQISPPNGTSNMPQGNNPNIDEESEDEKISFPFFNALCIYLVVNYLLEQLILQLFLNNLSDEAIVD
jgi:hypothetical protein